MRKYLRIAVTAVSLLVCALLIVLWVRSYYYANSARLKLSNSMTVEFFSDKGIITVSLPRRADDSFKFSNKIWILEWRESSPIAIPMATWLFMSNKQLLIHVSTPYWFYVTIFATIAYLPWMKWRFSLRTLLIVMTLFALFFGAVAWSMRG